ncbi:hypothetical protein L1987_56394 [Smallanthus sonchifolius]|uniref:Uncharacterized protein n=1 Tax=Smallanthus sonchifolius TaxID=185202 RepID=A0ACB9EDB2_9ASTR|nr:hypothetical protein L1987_56394 [Smallanthus sonchifolius]
MIHPKTGATVVGSAVDHVDEVVGYVRLDCVQSVWKTVGQQMNILRSFLIMGFHLNIMLLPPGSHRILSMMQLQTNRC